jgi:hypothetical protein
VRGDESVRCRPAVIDWRELTPGTRPVTPDEPSDIELWDRAVDGDHESFSVLFERHAPSVYQRSGATLVIFGMGGRGRWWVTAVWRLAGWRWRSPGLRRQRPR